MGLQQLEGNGQQKWEEGSLSLETNVESSEKKCWGMWEGGKERRSRKRAVLLLKAEVEISLLSEILCITGVSTEVACLSILA